MPAKTAQAWEQCLQQMAQRDGAVEISSLASRESLGLAPTFRVRLLVCRPAGMVVDRPAQEEESRYFQPGTVVRLLVTDGASRWELITTVTSRIRYQLNDQTIIQAMILARPHEVSSVQRRDFYRVSTAGVRMDRVLLTPLSGPGELQDAQPLPEPFKGILVNVGGGGMGVESPRSAGVALSLCHRFHAVLALFENEKPLEIDCTLVHLAPQPSGTHYLGLRFDLGDDISREKCADHICRFTVWLQRQQLQRMHEKR